MEFASNGKGNLGVTLGAIGTGMSILNGGLGLLNTTAVNTNVVTKDELKMVQELANKDSEIALLKAESDSENKMIEVYKQSHAEVAALRDTMNSEFKEIRNDMNANRIEQSNWNASQSVINAQISAAIATNTNSIASINGLLGQITQTKVPNSAVCPGWGNVAINPVGSGTTIA